MQNLLNATIIIPTKNRPIFIERLLKYYSQAKEKCTLLIADGSDGDQYEEMKTIISKYSSILKIDYLHKSDLGTSCEMDSVREIDSRILEAIGRVNTPFIALSGDDDFFIPESIEKGVMFLENNPSFELYHGEALYFILKNNEPYGPIEQIGEYAQYSIIDDSALNRCISFLLFHYASIWHSVFRTETLKKCYKIIHSNKLDLTFFEPFFSTLLIMQGKVFCDTSLSLVRQGGVKKDFDDIMLHDYVTWLSNPEWIDKYDKFINGLAQELTQIDKTEKIEDMKILFRKVFWCNISKDLALHCNNFKKGMENRDLRNINEKKSNKKIHNTSFIIKKKIKPLVLYWRYLRKEVIPNIPNLVKRPRTHTSGVNKTIPWPTVTMNNKYEKHKEIMEIFHLITSETRKR